jgi:hypothetical protein
MTQRGRDNGEAKPLYASEPVEHVPHTVHPIALPAGPEAGEQHKTGPHMISMAGQLAARPRQLRGPASPPRTQEDAGPLLIIGGAEGTSPPSDTILATFVELAGGQSAQIAVIATASNDPDCREIEYQRVFTRLGAGRVTPLRITDRDHASSPEAAAAVHTARGVFFTGGDQTRITTVLGCSKVEPVLHRRVLKGMTVAGT